MTSQSPTPCVLLVEDDRSTQVLYAQALERAGVQVITAATVSEALHVSERVRPDVVITDLTLHDESGIDLLHRLEGATEDIPVIIVTADERAESMRSALQGRAFDYITKPVVTTELVDITRKALALADERRRQSEQLSKEFLAKRELLATSGQRAALLSLLFNRAAEGILVLDRAGVIVDASDSFLNLVDRAPHLIVGANIDQLFAPHPSEGPIGTKIRQMLERPDERDAWSGALILHHRIGEQLWCNVRVFRCEMPSLDGSGDAPYAVALVFHDTHRAEVSRQLQQAERLATIGLMAGSAAHEIKNDLGPLIGYISLLGSDGDKDPMVGLLHDSTRRIHEHVEQILEPLRPRIRSRGAVSLRRAVDDVLLALRRAGKLRRLDLEIEMDEEGDIFVLADRDEIHQIVMNLLTNAVDGLEDGGGGHRGSVTIYLEQGDRHAAISFEDDGRGIAQDKVERVFEPFFTTKGDLGTGLGLPVVRDIVQALAGTITLQSDEGLGTTVTVKLPRFLGDVESSASSDGQ